MAIRYRCKKKSCGKRVSLPKRLHQYLREPTCPECKGELRSRNSEKKYDTARTCKCPGIPWPHRVGAIIDENRFCHERELVEVESKLEAQELGADSKTMKPEEPCPF